jgi:hypothetical protein
MLLPEEGWDGLDLTKFAIYGGAATLAIDVALYPFELVKTKMQVEATVRKAINRCPLEGTDAATRCFWRRPGVFDGTTFPCTPIIVDAPPPPPPPFRFRRRRRAGQSDSVYCVPEYIYVDAARGRRARPLQRVRFAHRRRPAIARVSLFARAWSRYTLKR